jgi:hypothetical protein
MTQMSFTIYLINKSNPIVINHPTQRVTERYVPT